MSFSDLEILFLLFGKEFREGTYTRQASILFNPHALRGTKQSPGRPAQQAADILAAPCVVTCRVFGQESAEAILGEGSHYEGTIVAGNELGE